MAKKTVTKKKTRSTSGRTATSARTRSKKTKTTRQPAKTAKKSAKTARKPAKTTRKPPAKVAKRPAKKTGTKTATNTAAQTKKTAQTETRSAATTSRTKKKTATTASAGSRKISSKTATKPRSRSAKRPAPDANGYVIINGRRVRMMAAPLNPPLIPPKRTRTKTKPASEPEPAGKSGKSIKTKLARKDLNRFRTQLLIQRAELVGDLSAMEGQALRSGAGNPSHMPIHMADVGTDTFDQDFMLGLAEAERRRLREIDVALKRIEDRTYGVCELTGKTIPKARLDAKPWARYTIESAREVERGLGE